MRGCSRSFFCGPEDGFIGATDGGIVTASRAHHARTRDLSGDEPYRLLGMELAQKLADLRAQRVEPARLCEGGELGTP